MRTAVVGLWHTGTVTAACLASTGRKVVGRNGDPDATQAMPNRGAR